MHPSHIKDSLVYPVPGWDKEADGPIGPELDRDYSLLFKRASAVLHARKKEGAYAHPSEQEVITPSMRIVIHSPMYLTIHCDGHELRLASPITRIAGDNKNAGMHAERIMNNLVSPWAQDVFQRALDVLDAEIIRPKKPEEGLASRVHFRASQTRDRVEDLLWMGGHSARVFAGGLVEELSERSELFNVVTKRGSARFNRARYAEFQPERPEESVRGVIMNNALAAVMRVSNPGFVHPEQ